MTDQTFPTGAAYQHLGVLLKAKLLAVDDGSNPPVPGWMTPQDLLDAVAAEGYASLQAISDAVGREAKARTDAAAVVAAAVGQPDGVASLGADTRVPWPLMKPALQQLPLAFILVGKPAAGQKYNLVLAAPATIPANFAGTVGYVGIALSGDAVFSLSRVNASGVLAIGTVTLLASGAFNVSLSAQAAFSAAAGEVLQLGAPAAQDATGADMAITILAAKV